MTPGTLKYRIHTEPSNPSREICIFLPPCGGRLTSTTTYGGLLICVGRRLARVCFADLLTKNWKAQKVFGSGSTGESSTLIV